MDELREESVASGNNRWLRFHSSANTAGETELSAPTRGVRRPYFLGRDAPNDENLPEAD